jgi:yopX protein
MKRARFRAWSNEYSRYCDFVTLDELGRWIGWIKTSGVFFTTIDIVIEQSTDIKDKNGKEVYQGDIVAEHNGDNTGQIVQHASGEWQIAWIGIFGGVSKLYDHRDWCEVIGDIHESRIAEK